MLRVPPEPAPTSCSASSIAAIDGRVLAHAEIVVRAPDGDRLGPVAAEAARVGEIALGAQDIDEHAIAALVVEPLDRRLENAVVIQGSIPSLARPLAAAFAQFHCEQLAIAQNVLDLAEPVARRARSSRGRAGRRGEHQRCPAAAAPATAARGSDRRCAGRCRARRRHSATPGKAARSSSASSGKWVQARTTVSIRSPSGASNIGCAAARTAVDADRLAGELGLGQLDQLGRAVADDRAVGGELRGEVVDIGLADRRLGAEHADHAALRHFRRGLDRRDRADDRQVERRADMIERDGRGGVAGDHREARVEALDQPAEQGGDAAGDLRLAPLAVGKAGAVGGIDDRRVGQQRARRRRAPTARRRRN